MTSKYRDGGIVKKHLGRKKLVADFMWTGEKRKREGQGGRERERERGGNKIKEKIENSFIRKEKKWRTQCK